MKDLQSKLNEVETTIASYKGMRIPKFAKAYYNSLLQLRTQLKMQLNNA